MRQMARHNTAVRCLRLPYVAFVRALWTDNLLASDAVVTFDRQVVRLCRQPVLVHWHTHKVMQAAHQVPKPGRRSAWMAYVSSMLIGDVA